MSAPESQILGRYQLLALLATGGMAEIHLARQKGIQGFERLVVVKKILPHLARERRFLEMFLDEARLAAQLNHSNIVQVHDLGQEGDEYYIAMEYLEGESLGYTTRQAIRSGNPMPPDLAAGAIMQVCDGLGYAHKMLDEAGLPLNIVHRDICPQNIIVLFSGVVKIVDFGIAKAATQVHKTRVGTMKGKLAYMPPEQCLAKPVDARSDLFSLGTVFWELLTHRRLFKRDSDGAMIQAIVSEDIPMVRKLQPDVPKVLEAIVQRAVERNPADRFQSADEMGAAIRDYLRRSGAAASVHDIQAFVGSVFSERARTKRQLLDNIRASGGAQVSLGLLKPDTEESMPSRSELKDSEQADGAALQQAGEGAEAPEIKTDEPPTKRLTPPPLEPHLPPADEPDRTGMEQDGDQPESTPVVDATILRAGTPPLIPRLAWVVAPTLVVLALLIWWAIPGDPGATVGGESAPVDQPSLEKSDPPPIREEGQDKTNRPTGKAPRPEKVATDAREDPAKASEPADRAPLAMDIQSDPSGCKVEVDEVEVPGQTPLTEVTVEASVTHRVAVLCKGHLPQLKQITGDPGTRIDVAFAPVRIEKKPGPIMGTLRLNTKPWSEVFWGKRKLGMTPLRKRLPVGTHKLTAVNQEQGIRKTFTVEVQAGKTTNRFEPLR